METELEQLQHDRLETQKTLEIAIDFIMNKGLYDEYMRYKQSLGE